jgi:hypothetical protein
MSSRQLEFFVMKQPSKTLKTIMGSGDEIHQAADAVLLTDNHGHPVSDNQNSLRAGNS